MAKVIHCGEIMSGCDAVLKGESVDEVMQKAAQHAQADHGLARIDEQTAKAVQGAIRDE